MYKVYPLEIQIKRYDLYCFSNNHRTADPGGGSQVFDDLGGCIGYMDSVLLFGVFF